MILTPQGVTFHPVVVIGLGKNLLFKSVLAHCGKVSFYPPNINIVLFYGKYTDIDIDAQYQEIYTDTFTIYQYHYKNIQKHFSSIY